MSTTEEMHADAKETREMEQEVASVRELCTDLGKRLRGHPPEIQSAVLADLLATWLAGHIVYGDETETDAMRQMLLSNHLQLVAKLTPINSKHIHSEIARCG